LTSHEAVSNIAVLIPLTIMNHDYHLLSILKRTR